MQPGSSSSQDDAGNEIGLETLRFLEQAQVEGHKNRKKAKAKGREVEGKTLGETLTWLNLSGNTSLGAAASSSEQSAFHGLEGMKQLFVLNISSSALRRIPPKSTLMELQELRALILSHNRLTAQSLESLPHLPNLNTLVLSHNDIESLPASLPSNVPQLAKLSLSHNNLLWEDQGDDDDDFDSEEDEEQPSNMRSRASRAPDFTMNSALREVRLSHNPKLRGLPSHLSSWGRGNDGQGRGLDLLEVGHCSLSWSNVSRVLLSSQVAEDTNRRRNRGLKNLTLAGNPDIDDQEDSKERMQEGLPTLVVLDNQRLKEKGKKGDGDRKDKDGPAQWPQREGDASTEKDATGSSKAEPLASQGQLADQVEAKAAEERGKKRKRGGRGGSRKAAAGDDEDEATRRLLARAGPAPGGNSDDDDDDGGVGGVASDDEPLDKRDFGRGNSKGAKKRAKKAEAQREWKSKASVIAVDQDDSLEEKTAVAEMPTESAPTRKKAKKLDKKADKKAKAKAGAKADATPPEPASPKSKAKKSLGGSGKASKKAVAWDHVEAAAETAASTAKTDTDEPAAKAPSKAQTAIAGIVEVKRPKSKSAATSSSKDDVPKRVLGGPAAFGAGAGQSAWLDGSGDGNGGSAWD